ncbi:hypothetical protein NPIL_103271 [Nephila pilipes]|uniref:Uncharacterized protein n=1 Tax=Nephila pilipes TaxID=299642 RepID=A0A8X6UXZ2_NEPPI|nr:hypothetical protein NPIL_340161 [Nephila pilipes]GFU63089.1 hypothetical protein NPIL_103271 [Nephila pilipes]
MEKDIQSRRRQQENTEGYPKDRAVRDWKSHSAPSLAPLGIQSRIRQEQNGKRADQGSERKENCASKLKEVLRYWKFKVERSTSWELSGKDKYESLKLVKRKLLDHFLFLLRNWKQVSLRQKPQLISGLSSICKARAIP